MDTNVKKIILIDGSTIVSELLARALNKEHDFRILHEIRTFDDVLNRLDRLGRLDADWLLTFKTSGKNFGGFADRLPMINLMEVSQDGSQVVIRKKVENEVKKGTSLKDLIEIIRNAG
jgi:hypothetical protein